MNYILYQQPHEVSPSFLKSRPRKSQFSSSNETKPDKTVLQNHPALPVPKPKGAPLLHTPIVKVCK